MSKYKTVTEKSIQELDKLTTSRLLALLKSVRKSSYSNYPVCECCGEHAWHLCPNDASAKASKAEYESVGVYIQRIKTVLKNREHVTEE